MTGCAKILLLTVLGLTLALGAGACARRSEPTVTSGPGYDAEGLVTIKIETARAFPDVAQVSTVTVSDWMEDGRPLVLLDVREAPEFAVSHLRLARHAAPDAGVPELRAGALAGVANDARIVTYCSVGVRSASMARRLQDAGFSDVANLNGSIFDWANEGRPVFRDGVEVSQVHPYDKEWGRLLDPAHHPR